MPQVFGFNCSRNNRDEPSIKVSRNEFNQRTIEIKQSMENTIDCEMKASRYAHYN